ELTSHFLRVGRFEGRRGWLRGEDLRALGSDRFVVSHYRALHSEVVHLSEAEAVVHYVTQGRRAGLRARLTRQELRALRGLNLADYRAAHADLAHHSEPGLVQHFLEHGLPEGRRASL